MAGGPPRHPYRVAVQPHRDAGRQAVQVAEGYLAELLAEWVLGYQRTISTASGPSAERRWSRTRAGSTPSTGTPIRAPWGSATATMLASWGHLPMGW